MNRPLGSLTHLVTSLGLNVSYAYDDLVFVEHNAFLFRFQEHDEPILLFFNRDCPENEARPLKRQILDLSAAHGLRIVNQGTYSLHALADDEIRLEFFPGRDG